MIKNYIYLARIYQYSKNILIFATIFFSFSITNIYLLHICVLVFIGFCLVSSGIYVINDIIDKDADSVHPSKSNRPIPSGKISVKNAIIFLILLWTSSIFIFLYVVYTTQDYRFLIPICIYILLNLLYSFCFKHVAILDIFTIAVGFVLRIFIGSLAIDIAPSHWIIIITFLLALFLALAKKRDDVLLFTTHGTKTRKVVDGYNIIFLDIAMSISASVVLIAYILYTIDSNVVERFNSSYLYLTSIFVLAGIMRYLQIAFVLQNSGNPSKVLLKDRFLQIVILCWLFSFVFILYI